MEYNLIQNLTELSGTHENIRVLFKNTLYPYSKNSILQNFHSNAQMPLLHFTVPPPLLNKR